MVCALQVLSSLMYLSYVYYQLTANLQNFPLFLFLSGARCRACTEGPWGRTGRSPIRSGQAEREAEVL